MRIKYRILWVDDRKEEFERLSYDKRIVEYVQDLFFEPYLTFCETIEDAKDAINQNDFDIIFSDYNIDDKAEEQGDSFISYIRSRNVNTEVLFYSAMQELPTVRLNRVVFFSLAGLQDGYRHLMEQMKNLIDLTIRKLHDLTALRGIVMAEVSELDDKMKDVIRKYYVQNQSATLDKTFHDHITKKLEDKLKQALNECENGKKCIHIWRNMQIQDIIPKMESSQLAKAINCITPSGYVPSKANFYEDYLAEIIKNRNILAHCFSKTIEGKEYLITWEGDKTFSDEDIKVIRKNIMKYSNLFNEMLQ